jgi:hypothetical protein
MRATSFGFSPNRSRAARSCCPSVIGLRVLGTVVLNSIGDLEASLGRELLQLGSGIAAIGLFRLLNIRHVGAEQVRRLAERSSASAQ